MKLKNIFWIVLLTFFTLTSCGKKSALTYPEGQKRPKFDNVVDEK